MVIWYAGTTVPTGWLDCNGQLISRTTYATLFAAIGTTWGSGDGSTTFNLPNAARKAVIGRGGTDTSGQIGTIIGSIGGEETHVLTATEMPSHSHSSQYPTITSIDEYTGPSPNVASLNAAGGFVATTTSAGSGGAHNNMPPSMVMIMIIKAF
jgi:microcystin-dependent protein